VVSQVAGDLASRGILSEGTICVGRRNTAGD